MSVPDPSASPSIPQKPVISDRAALEAAIAGAASLLLGRVLLGRGAGFAAGTAVIAGRLLADWKNARQAEPKESAPAPETAAAATAAKEAEYTTSAPHPKNSVSDWGFPHFPEPTVSAPGGQREEFAAGIPEMPPPTDDAENPVPPGNLQSTTPAPLLPVFPDLSDMGPGELMDPRVELPGENFPQIPSFPPSGNAAAPVPAAGENSLEPSTDFPDTPDMPLPQTPSGEKSASNHLPAPQLEEAPGISPGLTGFRWTPPEPAASPEDGHLKESSTEPGIPPGLRSTGPLRPIPLPPVARPAPKNLPPGLSFTPQSGTAALTTAVSDTQKPDRLPQSADSEEQGQSSFLPWLLLICAILAALVVGALLWQYL